MCLINGTWKMERINLFPFSHCIRQEMCSNMTDIPVILTDNLRSLPFWEWLCVTGLLVREVSRFEMSQEECPSFHLRRCNF